LVDTNEDDLEFKVAKLISEEGNEKLFGDTITTYDRLHI